MSLKIAIARLQKATEGSRELDHLINVHVLGNRTNCKKFTTSIDAAVSLVSRILPGFGWSISDYRHHATSGSMLCFIHWPNNSVSEPRCAHETAKTTPLSICLTALLVLETVQSEERAAA